jgi:hypothetical protein
MRIAMIIIGMLLFSAGDFIACYFERDYIKRWGWKKKHLWFLTIILLGSGLITMLIPFIS